MVLVCDCFVLHCSRSFPRYGFRLASQLVFDAIVYCLTVSYYYTVRGASRDMGSASLPLSTCFRRHCLLFRTTLFEELPEMWVPPRFHYQLVFDAIVCCFGTRDFFPYAADASSTHYPALRKQHTSNTYYPGITHKPRQRHFYCLLRQRTAATCRRP